MMNISSYPKSTGFMRTIGQEDKFISFDNLDPDHILGQILEVWNDRENISQELIPLVTEEKRKARDSAKLLAKYLS